MDTKYDTYPYVNALKIFGMIHCRRWTPTLNSIIQEERITDVTLLKCYNDNGCQYVYNKKFKNRVRKIDAKINTAIKESNGLSAKLQNDGGANWSVMGMKALLLNFKHIKPYPMGGFNNNKTAITYIGYGNLP